jgi:hypothetical protein
VFPSDRNKDGAPVSMTPFRDEARRLSHHRANFYSKPVCGDFKHMLYLIILLIPGTINFRKRFRKHDINDRTMI